jgi:hypothetical protein
MSFQVASKVMAMTGCLNGVTIAVPLRLGRGKEQDEQVPLIIPALTAPDTFGLPFGSRHLFRSFPFRIGIFRCKKFSIAAQGNTRPGRSWVKNRKKKRRAATPAWKNPTVAG